MQHGSDPIPWSMVYLDFGLRRIIDILLLVYALWIAHPIIRRFAQQPIWPWADKLIAFLFRLITLVIVLEHQQHFVANWMKTA